MIPSQTSKIIEELISMRGENKELEDSGVLEIESCLQNSDEKQVVVESLPSDQGLTILSTDCSSSPLMKNIETPIIQAGKRRTPQVEVIIEAKPADQKVNQNIDNKRPRSVPDKENVQKDAKTTKTATGRFEKAHQKLFGGQKSIYDTYKESKTPKKAVQSCKTPLKTVDANKSNRKTEPKPKQVFDLAASLKRPVTWEMKKGPLR